MMTTTQSDDLELLSRLHKDDRHAFNALFLQYHPGLLRYGKTLIPHDHNLVEDLVQDIFLKIWNQRHTLTVHSSLSSFLFTSLKNKIKDAYRGKQFPLYDPTDMQFDEEINSASNPEHMMIYKELHLTIENLIQRLPNRTQLIYRMNREDNLSYDDIAKLLFITRSSVKTHMYRALKFLKECYLQYKTQH
ncbi:MAG: RNA polymerase sigma-70 factor [Pedobacter sp.]|nr:MAG: RNA polymerase sigma-70 factor [Pedobacter sp.]